MWSGAAVAGMRVGGSLVQIGVLQQLTVNLSVDSLAQYSVLSSLVTLMSSFDLGIGTIIANELQATTRDRPSNISELAYATRAFGALSVIVAITAAIVAAVTFCVNLSNLSPDGLWIASSVFVLVVLLCVGQLSLKVSTVLGYLRLHSFLTLCGALVALTAVVRWGANRSAHEVVWLTLGPVAVVQSLCVFTVVPWRKILNVPIVQTVRDLGSLMKRGGSNALAQLVSIGSLSGLPLLVGLTAPPSIAAEFLVASKIGNFGNLMVSSFVLPFWQSNRRLVLEKAGSAPLVAQLKLSALIAVGISIATMTPVVMASKIIFLRLLHITIVPQPAVLWCVVAFGIAYSLRWSSSMMLVAFEDYGPSLVYQPLVLSLVVLLSLVATAKHLHWLTVPALWIAAECFACTMYMRHASYLIYRKTT